jgi:hypothetical protein
MKKTMLCRDLGGPCDQKLSAATWKRMVDVMTTHVAQNHPDTARDMETLHRDDPSQWGNEMKPKWDATPEA